MKQMSAITITVMKYHFVKSPPRWANGRNKTIPVMVGAMKPKIRSASAIFVGRGTFVAALFAAYESADQLVPSQYRILPSAWGYHPGGASRDMTGTLSKLEIMRLRTKLSAQRSLIDS